MASINLNLGFKQEPQGKKSFVYKDVKWHFNNGMNKSKKDTKGNYILDAVKGFDELDDTQSVMNGIRNIFRWKKGQRIILPEFGNSLDNFLYEPITDLTAQNIYMEIKNMIDKWEPRANIKNINVIPDYDNNQYNVSVEIVIPTISANNSYTFNSVIS